MRDVSIETPLIGRKKALWVLAVCGFFSLAAPARADVVTDWNELAFRVSLIGGAPAQNAGRVAAIVQAAVFDALNGIDRRYTPIHVDSARQLPWRVAAHGGGSSRVRDSFESLWGERDGGEPTTDTGRPLRGVVGRHQIARTRRVGRQGHRVRT